MNSFRFKIISLLLSALMIIVIYPCREINADHWCGDNLTCSTDGEGNLTFTGSGNLHEVEADIRQVIRTVTIPDTVTHIDSYAFRYCDNLQSVILSNSLTKIEYGTFIGCKNLKEITIPKSITSIDPEAFSTCINLEKVVFEYDTTGIYLANASFEHCYNLTTIIARKPVITDWDYAFDQSYRYTVHYYYPVSFADCEHGSINGESISYGTDLYQLTITPDEDYELDHIIWSNGETTRDLTPNEQGQIEMPDSDTDVQLSAVFKRVSCTVRFMCENDPDPLQKTTYDLNEHPEYTMEEPTKTPTTDKTFTFSGWINGENTYGKDEELPELTEGVTYYAVFEDHPRTYEITFLDADGNEFHSGKYEYGTTPSCSGTPTKKDTDEYTYTFKGWAEANSTIVLDPLPDVTGEATYHPIFTDTVNEYEITFLNEDGTELQSEIFKYGTTPSFNGTPTKPADDKFTYTFAGWTPELTEVTGDANYVATYSAKAKPIPIDPDPIITPIPIPVTSVNPEVAASFEAFVERLYEVALDRESDPDGKAYWTNQVIDGNYTGADCIKAFLLSEEFSNRNLSDEEFVTVLYKALFDRDAADDPEGFNFWMNSLKTVGRDNVVDGFINSTEWCNVCATYGVKSGATRAKATTASKNATEFATRLYTECLGREPDESGLNYWSLALTNLDITGTEAARGFFFSDEFNNANVSNKELINKMYKTLLGREADDVGLAFWIKEMDNGMTKEQLFEDFSTSPEFTGICISYAIDR